MRTGDLVKWVREDHAYGLVGLVVAEPWGTENFEGTTWMVMKVLFSKHPFEEPEEVNVEDMEVISAAR